MWTDAGGKMHFSDNPRHAGFAAWRPEPIRPLPARHDRSWLDRSWTWDRYIERVAREHHLSPALVKAVIHVESGFDPDALSRQGARGLMQLMPATGLAMGVRDPYDPLQNIRGGTRYLKRMMQRFGRLDLALAAYNAGPTAVVDHGGIPPYRETRGYVRSVMALYRRYRDDGRRQ